MTTKETWAERGRVRYMTGAYDNLHSDLVPRMAKEIDANLTLISFTGTAGEMEKWKWRLVKPFVRRAHDAGLKVAFYMKLTNINWKPMFHERPESRDWIMVYRDGSPALYGGDTDRYMGCLNNPGWRNFLKEMIGEAVEHLADGLFYDNYFIPRELKRGASEDEASASGWACYCDTCAELFRQYTAETLGWECALPPTPDWDDPVWQAFIEFRDKSLVDVTRMIVSHAKELKPDIVVYPNVCPPWFGGGGAKGSATNQIADLVDILLFEGNQQPRLERVGVAHRPFTAAVDWKYATALSDRPVFYRAHTPSGVYTEEQTKLGILEGFAFGGSYQIIRAGDMAKDGDKREAVKRCYAFVKKNEKHYADVKPVADVAILASTPTFNWYYPDRATRGAGLPQSIQGIAQALAELHIPFDVVLDEQLTPTLGYRAVIAPNVACMSDFQAETVAKYVEQGGALVATGDTSLYDERYRNRKDFALADLLGVHHGQPVRGTVKSPFGKGRAAYLPGTPEEDFWNSALPDSLALIEDAVSYAVQDQWLIRVNAPTTTLLNVTEKRDTGAMQLHLLNYESLTPALDIAVTIRRPDGKSLRSVTLLSPDTNDSVSLESTQDTKTASFTVPYVEVYDLVVLEWE